MAQLSIKISDAEYKLWSQTAAIDSRSLRNWVILTLNTQAVKQVKPLKGVSNHESTS